MNEPRETLPESLRGAILSDLRPVRPLKPEWQRALALAPWAIVALVIYWLTLTPREDLAQLGLALSWGATILQALLAVGVGLAALREATPGSAWPRSTAIACALGASSVHIAIVLASFAQSKYPAPPELYSAEIHFCFTRQLPIGLPILGLGLWLMTRGFPLRSTFGGALAGLAAGLLAEASWRMICPLTDPSHMFPSHTGAVLLTALLGALLGWGIEHLRASRRTGRC